MLSLKRIALKVGKVFKRAVSLDPHSSSQSSVHKPDMLKKSKAPKDSRSLVETGELPESSGDRGLPKTAGKPEASRLQEGIQDDQNQSAGIALKPIGMADHAEISEVDKTFEVPVTIIAAQIEGEELLDRSHSLWKNMHALLIGINDYPGVPQLKGAVSDVDSMKHFLVSNLGVTDDNAHICVLKNADATRDNIVAAIDRLTTDPSIRKGDPILIFYAGHGSTLPKPPNWHATGSEIQCLVAYDARFDVSGEVVKGVVPDATIASLLHKLADAKGDNVTVILDCCHSGSGTRPGVQERGVEFEDDKGNQVTVSEDYDKEIREQFIKTAGRGAILDGKFLHRGLRSHVILAACASNERAGEREGGLFTSAILGVLKRKGDLIHDLTYVELIKSIGTLGDNQHPQCEGHYNRRILFNPQAIPHDRVTFDITRADGQILLYGGGILGITPGTEFLVYSSLEASLRDKPVTKVVAKNVVATECTVDVVAGQSDSAFQPNVTLVALRASSMAERLHICASARAKGYVETALALDSSKAYATRGWPQIRIVPESNMDSSEQSKVALVVGSDTEDSSFNFFFPKSSHIGSLGLTRPLLSVPRDLANPAFTFTRIRDILQASAHFFKYLQCEPNLTDDRSRVLRDKVQVHLYEVVEAENFQLLGNKIVRPLVKRSRIECDPELKGYRMKAASGEIPLEDQEMTRYGIEIVNSLQRDLFVWAFLFDCSSLAIRSYFEPRVAARGSFADAPVPGAKQSGQPVRVPLNFGSGGNIPLTFGLYPGQSQDVGFLRIFISTHYADLSSIAQESPVTGYEERVREEKEIADARGQITVPKRSSEMNFWNVITLPLIQRVEWDGATIP